MAIRNVLKEGDELLRKRSKPVTVFDERLAILLDDMKETMREENGAGIAAPQVGVLRRAVIIDYEGETTELINPVISNEDGVVIAAEGCLSVDSKKNCNVARPYKLTCTAQDRDGKPVVIEAEGWKARIICHEVDHLNGILFIDKAYKEPPNATPQNQGTKASDEPPNGTPQNQGTEAGDNADGNKGKKTDG
ncbi:MAG: peptide deformylase [Clostridia bacterium]